MTPLIKSLLGIGIVGGGAGLSVGGYYLLKPSEPKTLEEKFKREEIKVLDYKTENDSTTWTTKLTEYKAGTNKFDGVTGEESDGLKKLKDKCREHLEQSIEEIKKIAGLEDKVKKWCTVTK